jgi:1,4-alpha-glucan branching enzyme
VDNTAKLLAFHRWGAGPNDQVMVVINCSNNQINNYLISGFPANGTWFVNLNSDWKTYGADFGNFGSPTVQVSGGNGNISIGPYSVLVLSRSALPNLDSDGDGLLNGWEQAHFGDPLSGVATADDDGDGANNLQEQAADTDPHDANSVLKFTDLHTAGTNVVLTWKGGQAARQIIQQATALGGKWTSIFTNQPPTPVTNSISLPVSVSTSRFFRIQIAP